MSSLHALQQELACNKFYPPQITPSNSLFRSFLVKDRLGESACSRKAIVIEAQAGQGKSTLAAQFLHHFKLDFAWYQIGPEDADPVLLLSALLDNLQLKIPGFESPALLHIMRRGEIGPLDITRCANILLRDLSRHLERDFHIIFDDLHFGEQAVLLNRLLAHLIDTSPPRLHFILISRRPLSLQSKTLQYGIDTCSLNNTDLVLSQEEVENLYGKILKTPIERSRAADIRKQTSGWIMGILLDAHRWGKQQDTSLSAMKNAVLPSGLGSTQMLEYFQNEILPHLSDELKQPLIRLALLGQFSVELAERITGRKDMKEILLDLMRNNFFIYPLDDRRRVFRLHHLFQEFLQIGAEKHLAREEIVEIYQSAAEYYQARKQMEQAMLFHRKAENFQDMEDFFRTEGLNMMAKNRTITLLGLLKSIPEEQLLRHAWLTLFAGLLYSDFQPKKTLPLLESARNRFLITGEETGELLALAYLIYYHFVVSGLYHTGALLLSRTEELYTRNRDQLPLQAQIVIARNLGAGYCFFISRMESARLYSGIARDLSVRNDIRNGIASSRFVCGYIESLTDNNQACLREIELSLPLLHDPLVGMSNKLTLRILHLNYLSKTGAFTNYRHQQRILRGTIDNHVVEQTVAAPYLYIWHCAELVAAGDHIRGEELLQRGSCVSETARSPHIHSQLLQWQAYILALRGERQPALDKITESTDLRRAAGGPFYSVFHTILHGAVLSRCGDFPQAEELLSTALRRAGELPSGYLSAAVLFQRAWLYLLQSRENEAEQDIRLGLAHMEDNGYTYFWGWEPHFMEDILRHACRKGIAPHYAALLAKKRLRKNFDSRGNSVPVLSISVLGTFSIAAGGEPLLSIQTLTPAQRNILALILSAKDLQLNQEKIQLALWPDSPPEKSRAKLDTLLKRLRKTLDTVLPVSASHYLKMTKGIVRLENCVVDGVEFSRLARRGLGHAKSERYWQAANDLYNGLRFWEGVRNPESDIFTGETGAYHDQLLLLLVESTHRYACLLADSEATVEAIELLERTLSLYGMDDRLTTLLYTLCRRSGKMLKARETLRRYEDSLRKYDYSQEEIDELLLRMEKQGEEQHETGSGTTFQ